MSPAAGGGGGGEAADEDAEQLHGLGRLRLLMDANVTHALAIGSLFRADDNTTRDLCAATLFNILALTWLADAPTAVAAAVVPEPEPAPLKAIADSPAPRASAASAAESTGAPPPSPAGTASPARRASQPNAAAPTPVATGGTRRSSVVAPPPGLTPGAALRFSLMSEGVLWAVVKLTQGFAGE